jgi:hypothetical protein
LLCALTNIFYGMLNIINIQITPEFEEEVIEGTFEVKGSLIVAVPAFIALKLYIHNQIKKIIKVREVKSYGY